VAKIGESALDPVITPKGILLGHSKDKFDNLFSNRRTPDFLALSAVIPFSCHQFSMPTKKSFGGHNRADFREFLAAQNLSFDGQAAPLVIIEQDAFLAKLLFQYLVFSPQVLDSILLMVINPTRDDEEE
jgi:hypothetical protein